MLTGLTSLTHCDMNAKVIRTWFVIFFGLISLMLITDHLRAEYGDRFEHIERAVLGGTSAFLLLRLTAWVFTILLKRRTKC